MRTDPWLGKRDAGVGSPYAPGPEIGVFPMIRFDDWARDAHLERMDGDGRGEDGYRGQ